MAQPPVILASASAARARLLRDAGVDFTIIAADIDEAAVREAFAADQLPDPEDAAQILAEAKAATVSASHPRALVIGADQVLIDGEHILAKPGSIDEARRQLIALRGRTHRLASAVACAENGQTLWRTIAVADLTMRNFSERFLADYLSRMGDRVTGTVGGYQIEGLGIQLFERIDGDLFTIQGMPLLPLLAFLRERGIVAQ